MPNAPCPEVSRLRVSRLPCCLVLGYPCDAASAAAYGRLPEWPKGAVCKTVGSAYVGSNPTPATTCENGPLAAETRPRGRFYLCHAAYQHVSLCVDMMRCPRTYSGQRPGRSHGRGHRRLPRTATGGRIKGAVCCLEARGRRHAPPGGPHRLGGTGATAVEGRAVRQTLASAAPERAARELARVPVR